MTFTITRSSGTGSASVAYNVVPGTAEVGYDYYGTTSGTVVFSGGQTSKTISVTINSDSTLEYDETFQVVLSNPSTGRLGTSTATGTIRNDERMGIDGSLNVTGIAVPASVSDGIENLSDSNWKWGGALGTGAQVTYSFSTASSVFTYASGSEVPYTSLTAAQKATAVAAMNLVSSICGITFVEVQDTATSAGDIRWTLSTNGALSTAHAYYPSTGGSGGDVWIGPDASYLNPQPGEYGFHTFIHELGHALGLGHPHEGTPAAPAGEDQAKYSVMSYRDRAGSSTSGGYSASFYATSYMLNDIATLQYLYGANTTTNSTDTVYSWASNTAVMQTIWDTGGRDTISAATQNYAARIDLNPGAWSTIGTGYTIYNDTGFVPGPPFPVRDTLTIAYGAVIEDAIGSAQADTLIGNAVANRLTGGAGADTLTGGTGADVFFFAAPTDGGDRITDFVGGTDVIELSSPNFANLPIGTLAAGRLVSGAAPVAADGNAVFLYSTSSGQLVFDANGSAAGGTTLIATLTNLAALSSTDIRLASATT
jgi:serralysin